MMWSKPRGILKRKPNWREEEALQLVELVEERKHIIKGKFSPTLTSAEKKKTWDDISKLLKFVAYLLHLLTIWLWEVVQHSLQKLCWNSCLEVQHMHTGMCAQFLSIYFLFACLSHLSLLYLDYSIDINTDNHTQVGDPQASHWALFLRWCSAFLRRTVLWSREWRGGGSCRN